MAEAEETRNDRWRRIHGLSGAIALGAFLVEHLLTNAAALGGQASYERVVGSMERWSVLPVLEIVFVAVPLAFHAGYGLWLVLRASRSNAEASHAERYGGRQSWLLQRVSGVLVLLFLAVHLWETRAQRLFFGLSPESLHTTLSAHLSSTWASVPWFALLYLLGIGATSFHFANGLVAATAGANLAEHRRRRYRMASLVGGLLLFLLGAATVVGLATGTRLLPAADTDSAPCGSAVRTAPRSSSELAPSH